MTTLPSQVTIRQYIADGVNDEYTYPFYVTSKNDMDVYVQAADATPVPATDIQPVDTAYVVNNVGELAGGTITFQPGYIPANGYVITIVRNVQPELSVNFANVATFNGTTLDNALLKNMIVAAQNQSYALQRNLSYVVNDYLGDTDAEISSNTQLQRLQEGYIWIGTASGGVAAVLLSQSDDWSTLRSELKNDAAVTNGAAMIGYYDTVNSTPTTVADFLNGIVSFMQTQLVEQLWQTGDLKDHAGTSVPTGWLDCDGSAVSRTTYADLFAVIGTTYGAGDGSTTFNLPDFQRKTAVGSGGTAVGSIGNAVGDTGGEELHTMLEAEMFQHSHPGSTTPSVDGAGGTAQVVRSAGGGATGTVGVNVATQGSSQPFNVMQPSLVIKKLIKT